MLTEPPSRTLRPVKQVTRCLRARKEKKFLSASTRERYKIFLKRTTKITQSLWVHQRIPPSQIFKCTVVLPFRLPYTKWIKWSNRSLRTRRSVSKLSSTWQLNRKFRKLTVLSQPNIFAKNSKKSTELWFSIWPTKNKNGPRLILSLTSHVALSWQHWASCLRPCRRKAVTSRCSRICGHS